MSIWRPMRKFKYLFYLAILVIAGFSLGNAGSEAAARRVLVLPAEGSINPGLAEFIQDGIRTAEKEQA